MDFKQRPVLEQLLDERVCRELPCGLEFLIPVPLLREGEGDEEEEEEAEGLNTYLAHQ